MSQCIVTLSSCSTTRRSVRSLRASELQSKTVNRGSDEYLMISSFRSSVTQYQILLKRDLLIIFPITMVLIQIQFSFLMIMILSCLIVLLFLRKPITDQWVHAQINLPQGELLRKLKVFSRTKDGNGYIKCPHDPNYFLNTLTHDDEFHDC